MSGRARVLEVSGRLLEALTLLGEGSAEAAHVVSDELERSHPRLLVELLSTKRVPAGAGVSYGHTFVSARETTLGLAAIGYGDGLPRKAGNRAHATVASRGRMLTVPIVGRVAMNAAVIDLGDVVPDADLPVVVFGDPGRSEIALRDWSQGVGESPLAVLTGLAARVTLRGAS